MILQNTMAKWLVQWSFPTVQMLFLFPWSNILWNQKLPNDVNKFKRQKRSLKTLTRCICFFPILMTIYIHLFFTFLFYSASSPWPLTLWTYDLFYTSCVVYCWSANDSDYESWGQICQQQKKTLLWLHDGWYYSSNSWI